VRAVGRVCESGGESVWPDVYSSPTWHKNKFQLNRDDETRPVGSGASGEERSPSRRDESHCCRGNTGEPPRSASSSDCAGSRSRRGRLGHSQIVVRFRLNSYLKCSRPQFSGTARPTWPPLRCTQSRHRLSSQFRSTGPLHPYWEEWEEEGEVRGFYRLRASLRIVLEKRKCINLHPPGSHFMSRCHWRWHIATTSSLSYFSASDDPQGRFQGSVGNTRGQNGP